MLFLSLRIVQINRFLKTEQKKRKKKKKREKRIQQRKIPRKVVIVATQGRQDTDTVEIIIIKRISRAPIYHTRWQHRALYNNTNHTHTHTCTHARTRKHALMRARTHTHAHARTHARTHTRTHRHRHRRGERKGGKIEENKSCTQITCTYFVIQVVTSPCTTVKPEVGYQGAALQDLHKIKKTIYILNDSSVSFCNITNCVGNATNMRSVFLARHTLNNTIHTRMTQERAG